MDKPRRKSKKPRRTAKKPTNREYDDRIAFGRILLAQGITRKGDWKRAMRERCGDVSARTLESYLSRARELNREELDLAVGDLIADAVAFYDAVIANLREPMGNRIAARVRKDKLLGLERALKVEHTGKVALEHSGTVEAVAKIRQELLGKQSLVDALRQAEIKRADDPAT